MFLSLDECKGYGKNVLGLVVLPIQQLPELEGAFCALRLETKTMGELKWAKLTNNYVAKYIRFIDLFLQSPDATFHAITYTDKYPAAYSLIRVASWKLWNAGVYGDRKLFILFDNDTDAFPKKEYDTVDGQLVERQREFDNAYDAISRIAGRDGRLRHDISYCHQGASHQLGILQITDLLTGAMSAVINGQSLNTAQRTFVDHIRSAIGHEFDASKAELSLPMLKAYKLHFLDPVERGKKVHSTGVEPAPF